jgi:WS/DGAT/MGAT family acyltransferase
MEILGPEAQCHLAADRAERHTIGAAILIRKREELTTDELVGRVKKRVASMLDLAPRLTKVAVPVHGRRPAHVLIDGPPIDLDAHIRVSGIGEEVSRERCDELLTLFMDQPLDLDRPLWEIQIVPGVESGLAAIAFRVHHFIQDGVMAFAAGGMLLLDAEPDPVLREPPPYVQAPAPSEAALEAARKQILREQREEIAALAKKIGRDPSAAARRGRHIAKTYDEQLTGRRSELLARHSDRRGLEVVQFPFSAIHECQDVLGSHVSVNDVAVTLIVRGVAAMLGPGQCGGEVIRIEVPVTFALQEGHPEEDDFDKRTAAMVLALPLDEGDPRRLLKLVNEQSRTRKTMGARDISEMMHVLSLLPPVISSRATAALWSVGNMLFSNIPGPQQQLYVAGCEIESLFGMGNLDGRNSLRVVTLSFADQISFGIVHDKSAEGVERIGAGIREALGGLQGRDAELAPDARA